MAIPFRKPGPVTRLSAASIPIVDAGEKYDQDDVEAALQAAMTTAEYEAIHIICFENQVVCFENNVVYICS